MFTFKFNKALQAAAYLLRRETSQEMNYMRLLKILYIANRESIFLTGWPIIGGRTAAMKRGPVPSETYNLIKGQELRGPEWSRYIQKKEYNVRLICDPGQASLSRFDIETLERVAEDHRAHDEWELVEITHGFPEWQKNDPGESLMNWIQTSDIFEAVNRQFDSDINNDAKEDRAFARLFGE